MIEIYEGDNLEILRGFEDEKFNLIYIDPPFNTGKDRVFNSIKAEQSAQGNRVGYGGKKYRTEVVSTKSYADRFTDYHAFIRERLEEAYRVLHSEGSLFFHVDCREVHYCKIILDEIFGRDCFQNEIIWSYDYGARSKKKWSAKHDNILWYTKHKKKYTYNYDDIDRIPYMAPGLVGSEKAAKGKAQPISEPILTPDGWKKIGDIKTGDYVFGSEGKPVKVIGVFPQGNLPIYKLNFSDQSSSRSSLDHLWTFETFNKKRYTQPLYEWEKNGLFTNSGKPKWHLPIVKAIEYSKKEYIIDPYTLGAFLGGGCFSGSQNFFTSMDEDIIANLVLPEGHDLVFEYPNSGKYESYIVRGQDNNNEFIKECRILGLQGRTSLEKFIPKNYKEGSVDQRISLLQGLFDTNGSARKGKTVDYSTSSYQLACDVVDVVQSLGGTAKIRRAKTTHPLSARIYIRLPLNICPFRCKRKKEIFDQMFLKHKSPYRKLLSINECGSEECVCIRVDSDDFLYVTKDHILTHNTPTSVWWHTIVSPNGKEKTGYPTQKPLGIINRIVNVHSNPGDLLLDFFAGSGTLGESAQELGRHCFLVDSNPQAVETMRQRFAKYGNAAIFHGED